MKKLKLVAVILIAAQILSRFVISHDYYAAVFKSLLEFPGNIRLLMNLTQNLMWTIIDVSSLVFITIFLFAADSWRKDKAYRNLRYIYVMIKLLFLPFSFYYIFVFNYHGLLYITMLTISVISIVLLLIAKPEQRVPRIDLQQYDVVRYTSDGHRFLHYLLDMLFLVLIYLAFSNLPNGRYGHPVIEMLINVLPYLTYLWYCFLSEAIFSQTFGKLVTGSCVASRQGPLTTGKIIGRTFARLVPFDAFSFLAGGNWHDSFSSTAVVYTNSLEKVFEASASAEEPPVFDIEKEIHLKRY